MNDRKKTSVLWLKKEELKQARQCLDKIEPFFENNSLESKYNRYTQIQGEISQLLENNKPARQSLIEEQVKILQEMNNIQQIINSNNNEEEKKKFERSLSPYQPKLNDIKKKLDDLGRIDNELKIVIKIIGVLLNNLGSEQPPYWGESSQGDKKPTENISMVPALTSWTNSKEIFQILKKILSQEKETSKPRTYCHTGTIAEKLRDKLSKSSKHPGDEFFRLTLENKVVFYAFQHELDNKDDYQNKVVPLAVGEKWEMEGHRWVADKYYLRRLEKIES